MKNHRLDAIILAAGNGSRLQPLTNQIPKVMVDVCGKTIIKRALDNLAELNKINKIMIIVGYKAEKIRKHIGDSHKGIDITYIMNDDYNSTNNMYSLWLAKDYINRNTILLEGDVVFEKEMLIPLLDSRHPNLALVTKYNKSIPGTVITMDEKTNKITNFIGSINQKKSKDYFNDKYKTINIYSFEKQFIEKHFMPSMKNHMHIHGKNDFYEVALESLVRSGVEIHAHLIDNKSKWYEIDNIPDLKKASSMFSK